MSELYVAASLWGHAIDEAKKGKPCCLDAETILTTQEQITRLRALVDKYEQRIQEHSEFMLKDLEEIARLRALVEAKDSALRDIIGEAEHPDRDCVEILRLARAALDKD